eukprot:TRINITY_DN66723_c0_g1_i1.p1 TRINITY_DN66723_c0_g1~~TRINITY_DN66723_c0_g1_i1.p1  ORF type:complete len:636 (+),score=65.38 TRINITY_DN66723_c0_g1_i1:75-1910(+)
MDCFYVAVEIARDPRLTGKPCAVVQYNTNDRGMPDLPADADRWKPNSGPFANSMGGIIAVSYEARARGVTRQMMGREARKMCPEIILVQVPTAFGKADLKIYKDAGDSVVDTLAKRSDAIEKRSVDEVALDITSEAERILAERDWATQILPAARRATHLADSKLSREAASVSKQSTRNGHGGQRTRSEDTTGGCHMDWQMLQDAGHVDVTVQRLIAGAVVLEELRMEVKSTLGFSCSGGVATNKILAKLGCGLHKPNQQTILLPHAVPLLLEPLPLDRLPGLGGDLGAKVKAELGVSTAGELVQRHVDVMKAFPDKGEWLLALARGSDTAAEPVKDRQLVRSLSNSKTFFGRSQLKTAEEVEYWLREFSGELHKRYREQVERHQRAPSTIGIHVTIGTSFRSWQDFKSSTESFSRQQPISLGRDGTRDDIANAAIACFRRWLAESRRTDIAVLMLGLNLSKMASLDKVPISSYFKKSSSQGSDKQSASAPRASQTQSSRAQAVDPATRSGTLHALFGKGAASKAAPSIISVGDESPHEARRSTTIVSTLSASVVDKATLAELPLHIRREIEEQLGLSTADNSLLPKRPAPPSGLEGEVKKPRLDVIEIDID